MNLALLLFLRRKGGGCELGKRRVGGIESKGSRLGYGNVDMDIFVKVRLKTAIQIQLNTFWGSSIDLRELAKL